ncbi:hypothetical protein COEREDRAFT_42909, partial [Coemansia reversa NRRL 1564]
MQHLSDGAPAPTGQPTSASESALQPQHQKQAPQYDSSGELPPQATTSTAPPEKKKKRLTQACQHCRKKKIRCDGIRPSCKNCIKNKSPCTYLPSIRKRG